MTPGSFEIVNTIVDLECCRVFTVHNVGIVAVSLPCQIFRAEMEIYFPSGGEIVRVEDVILRMVCVHRLKSAGVGHSCGNLMPV